MLLMMIIGCEIGFWVLLGAGLAARYLLRLRRTGTALLLGVPLLGVALLVATLLDLGRGATAGFNHGLAAAYLGFTVAFGPATVRWADARMAHRLAGGPPPRRPPRHGPERVRHEWRGFGRGALGWAVACGLLLGGAVWIGDADRAAALLSWVWRLTFAMAVWLVCWPLWETAIAAFGTARRGPDRGPSAQPSPAGGSLGRQQPPEDGHDQGQPADDHERRP